MVGSLPSLHLYPQGQSDSGERSRHCFIFSVISSSKPQERWILCCHLTFLWPNLSPTLEWVRGCCLQRLLVVLNLEHAGSSSVHSEESKALSPALKSLLGNMLQQESESWSQPGGEKGLLSLHFSFSLKSVIGTKMCIQAPTCSQTFYCRNTVWPQRKALGSCCDSPFRPPAQVR